MTSGVLIIGAGQAAAQLAISLRQGGFVDDIRMVGDEPYPPYQRPPLSKAFLKDRPTVASLFLRRESFWRDLHVALHSGTPVAAVDLARRHAVLSNGHEHGYATLVFATGTRARELSIPGIALHGVHSLRRIDDVQRLRPALDDARRIVIIGGGYIGLEVAAVLRQEGREAVVVEAENRVMKRVAGEATSQHFENLHRGHGVELRLGSRIAAIEGVERAAGVILACGARIAGDLVLVATGARANDDLAVAAGLACEDGILVNDFAQTAAPDVYAIGDCARFFSHRYGQKVRLECVQNAIDQAKAAARVILGEPEPYDPVPWFWSDQYDRKIQLAGRAGAGDDVEVIAGSVEERRFTALYGRGGRVVGVLGMNMPSKVMRWRALIEDATSWDAALDLARADG
jgi:3-phenylpropionate/trans-cinnamate dioxygenase ferredoxin reductase subunit